MRKGSRRRCLRGWGERNVLRLSLRDVALESVGCPMSDLPSEAMRFQAKPVRRAKALRGARQIFAGCLMGVRRGHLQTITRANRIPSEGRGGCFNGPDAGSNGRYCTRRIEDLRFGLVSRLTETRKRLGCRGYQSIWLA